MELLETYSYALTVASNKTNHGYLAIDSEFSHITRITNTGNGLRDGIPILSGTNGITRHYEPHVLEIEPLFIDGQDVRFYDRKNLLLLQAFDPSIGHLHPSDR